MKELSLHLLDLVENSAAAGATHVDVTIEEDPSADRLRISIADDGRGMPPEMVRAAADPFTTTRTTRPVGMGLALLSGAAEQAGGRLTVESRQPGGTTVTAEFQLSSIDRAPLGQVEDTLVTVAVLHPDLALRYRHVGPGGEYEVNLPLAGDRQSAAEVRSKIERLVREGLQRIGSTA